MKAGTTFLICGILVLTCAVCGCAVLSGQDTLNSPPVSNPGTMVVPNGPGHFIFKDSLGNADLPVAVFTYRPASWNQSGPILIIMHGAGRNGQDTRDTWAPIGEQYSTLIVVPEFSGSYYPGDNMYIGGNMYDSKGHPNPKTNWTYTAIEHLFDDIREKTGAKKDTYLLFGHSAGAQFVHRLVTFLPEARYSRAVAANAGVYALPVYTVPYGFGLKNSPLAAQDLPKVFSRKLIIMSGEADNNPSDSSLANFPWAEAQGKTRFERARFYFDTAQSEAGRIHVPLNWEYHTVPGIGHDEAGMAGPSAVHLFTVS